MLDHPAAKWCGGVLAVAIIVIASSPLWWPMATLPALNVPSELLTKLAKVPTDSASEVLTEIADQLPRPARVSQVLLLQAVPDEAALVIATAQDSSDEEGATHWPAPWEAVNSALRSGKLLAPVAVQARHSGFDYQHHLIPVDAGQTQVLLVNQSAPAPAFRWKHGLLSLAGLLLLLGIWLPGR